MSEFLTFFVSAVASLCVHLGKGLKLVVIYVEGYLCSCGWVFVDDACELIFVRVCGLKGVFGTACFVRFLELGVLSLDVCVGVCVHFSQGSFSPLSFYRFGL